MTPPERASCRDSSNQEITPPRESEMNEPRATQGTFRSGFVGVLGQTNVGKSTFLNAVLREKILLTSSKPQATRTRIRCIASTDKAQIVFVDTPGFHRPKTKLGRHLVREAYRAVRGIDVLLYVVEPWGRVHPLDLAVLDRLGDEPPPILLLVNKIDQAKGNALEETLLAYAATDRFAELIPISATQRKGLDDVVETVTRYLPVREPLFPIDAKHDLPDDFLIAELIREKVFQYTFRELPYSIAVRVKWIHVLEDRPIEIHAEIIVDRESQKGIIVGKGGKMIRRIGTLARADIETLLGQHVYLELIAKVQRRLTEDDDEIRKLTDAE